MRFWILAGVSTFTAFALFAAIGSLLARAGAAVLTPWIDRRVPAIRARLLFRLRLLPGICAAIVAFGVALPIFLWFEAADTTESVNLTLGLVALAGLGLMARSVWRAAAAWRSTARVLADWQRRGRVLDDIDSPLPAYAIDDEFPIVALIGIRRPQLFVAERVLRECPPAEVSAMIAHECAHLRARDNVKRLLIRACPDVFGLPRQLDRAWHAAAEEAADDRAGVDARTRLNLASALIHVARLAVPVQPPPLASAFYLGGSIDERVRRLVQPPAAAPPSWSGLALPAALVLIATALVAAAPSLHDLMERAIRLLP